MSTGKVLLGLLAGAAAGATLGILLVLERARKPAVKSPPKEEIMQKDYRMAPMNLLMGSPKNYKFFYRITHIFIEAAH